MEKNNLNKIEEIVKLVFLSSYLKNEKPLSLILIAPPEHSKSHFLLKYTTKNSHISTDLSYFGLINLLKNDKKIKQIVIPDFLKVTEKNQNTKKSIISALSEFIEDGIYNINLANKEPINLKGRKGGILTATTPYSYRQNYKNWNGLGFKSRFLFIQYEQSSNTINKIMEKIAREEGNKKIKKIRLSTKSKLIKSNQKLNKKLILLSEFSRRKLKNYKILLKTIALKNNHDKPTEEDFKELEELSKIIKSNEVIKI